MRLRLLALVGALSLVSGCGTTIDIRDPGAVAAATTSEKTKFDSGAKWVAPVLFSRPKNGGLLPVQERIRLRGWQGARLNSHQLYINIWYHSGSWRFYESASFEGGQKADIQKISRDVASCQTYFCNYDEHFGISLTESFLRQHEKRGFEVRVEAKSGHKNVLTVPAEYIQGYLLAVGNAVPTSLDAVPIKNEVALAADTPTERKNEKDAQLNSGQSPGPHSYDAERLAIQSGCVTEDRSRPIALPLQKRDGLEIYDIKCHGSNMMVRCEYRVCQLMK